MEALLKIDFPFPKKKYYGVLVNADCFACNEKIEGNSDGYHGHCRPCLKCGKALVDDRYVDSETLCHDRCLECKKCGLAMFDGYYVDPEIRHHPRC